MGCGEEVGCRRATDTRCGWGGGEARKGWNWRPKATPSGPEGGDQKRTNAKTGAAEGTDDKEAA